MYDIGDAGGLYASMPPNMQDEKTDAFCYAVERQAGKIRKLLQRLNVWSDLEHVEPAHYDFVAACLRSLYYRSDMADERKLAIIRSTMLTYRYAGSMRAVEELLHNLFSEAEFIPWYKYGGKPFCFKIQTSDTVSKEGMEYFLNVINKVKSARDHAEIIEVNRISSQGMHVGIARFSHSRCTILDSFHETERSCLNHCVGMVSGNVQNRMTVMAGSAVLNTENAIKED